MTASSALATRSTPRPPAPVHPGPTACRAAPSSERHEPTAPRLLLPPSADPEPRAVEPFQDGALPRLVSVRSPLDAAARWATAEPEPGPAELPDPRGVAGPLVLAAQEALMGARSLAQLTRWVTPEVYQQLTDALPLTRTTSRRARGRIVSVRAARVSTTVAEATVVLHDGDRVRAAALRLEEHRGRWRATVLEIG